MWLLKEVKISRYNAFHLAHVAEDLWSKWVWYLVNIFATKFIYESQYESCNPGFNCYNIVRSSKKSWRFKCSVLLWRGPTLDTSATDSLRRYYVNTSALSCLIFALYVLVDAFKKAFEIICIE